VTTVALRRGRRTTGSSQGLQEHDSDALLHEYRRNVGRWSLRQKRSQKYPSMPQNYFDTAMEDELALLQEKGSSTGSEDYLQR
jgi:hypothetical protein